MSLASDIASLLNAVSAENESDTPDFILGEFLAGCLEAFNEATNARTDWFNS